jgi:AraC-like DNA-binding protein
MAVLDKLDIVTLIYLLGTAQGLFLTLALLTARHGDPVAARLLGSLTGLFTLVMFVGLTQDFWPIVRLIFWPKEFFYGPLILFYVLALTRPSGPVFRRWRWLHWLPGVVHLLGSWSLAALPQASWASILWNDNPTPGRDALLAAVFNSVEGPLSVLHLGAYMLVSIYCLRQHRQRVRENFSYTEQVSLNWLRLLINALLCLYGLFVAYVFIGESYNIAKQIGLALDTGLCILIYAMGYLGLRQPVIFAPRQPPSNEITTIPEPEPDNHCNARAPAAEQGTAQPGDARSKPKKYGKSALSPELGNALMDELRQLMRHEQLWLDNRLTLPQLAERLGVSANYLSQAINERGEQNFFDFINSYRVRESQRLLLAQPNESVLNIALAAGFNSKSAFYTAFRKHTGQTPTNFRDTQAAQSAS